MMSPTAMTYPTAVPQQKMRTDHSTTVRAVCPNILSTIFSYVGRRYLSHACTNRWIDAEVAQALTSNKIPPQTNPAWYNANGSASIPAPNVAEHKFATQPKKFCVG